MLENKCDYVFIYDKSYQQDIAVYKLSSIRVRRLDLSKYLNMT